MNPLFPSARTSTFQPPTLPFDLSSITAEAEQGATKYWGARHNCWTFISHVHLPPSLLMCCISIPLQPA